MMEPTRHYVSLHRPESVAAVFALRKGCARTLYYTAENAALAAPWAEFLRSKNGEAHLATDAALRARDPLATHGLLLETERPEPRPPTYAEVGRWQREGRAVLCVDGIRGAPLGDIVKCAADAGFSKLVFAEHEGAPDDAAYDAAEGGFERIRAYRTRSLHAFLRDSRRKFLTVTTGSAGRPLEKLKPPRAPGRPLCLVVSAGGAHHPCELSVRALLSAPAQRETLFRILQHAIGAVN